MARIDQDYHARRERDERAAEAAAIDPLAKLRHRQLASQHAARASGRIIIDYPQP